MGLIINKQIRMLIKGYPTVSDKYNVAGGILAGNTSVKFGELVKYSSTTGYYEAITSAVDLTDIAGIILATNVKLTDTWAGETEPETKVGEAFNLLLDGYVAVELDSSAVEANIAAGKSVAVILDTGKLTTSGAGSATDIPGYVFTGIKEKVGDVYLAEIKVK